MFCLLAVAACTSDRALLSVPRYRLSDDQSAILRTWSVDQFDGKCGELRAPSNAVLFITQAMTLHGARTTYRIGDNVVGLSMTGFFRSSPTEGIEYGFALDECRFDPPIVVGPGESLEIVSELSFGSNFTNLVLSGFEKPDDE